MDEKAVAVSRLLNRLNAAVWDLRARRGDRWQIAKDTVATSVAQKLKDDAVSLESQLTGLDEDLQEKARQDIRMQLLLAFRTRRWVLLSGIGSDKAELVYRVGSDDGLLYPG